MLTQSIIKYVVAKSFNLKKKFWKSSQALKMIKSSELRRKESCSEAVGKAFKLINQAI